MTDRLIKSGWHWQFGYLRVREKDEDGVYAYEGPSGQLIMSTLPRHRHYMYMDQWQDDETGEMYVTDSPVPRVYDGRFKAWPLRLRSAPPAR